MRLLSGLLMLCAAASALSATAAEGPRRPHVVLFLSDDHTWHDCGPYGARDVRTPNLDRLAREGMRFDAAFAASPTCTPSRSALYTGMYPFRNGAHANHSIIKDGIRTMPEYMSALGYRVVLAGKTHVGPRERFPFEYLAGSNVMPAGKNHVLWTDLNTASVDALLKGHDRARPLCLVVCSHSPHVYWPENQAYEPGKVALKPYLVDTPETRRALCRYYTDVGWMDRQVGEVMDALAKHGYAEETMFIYAADQGAQFPFAKWNLYDAGVRVPLLVRWPGKATAGSSSGALVSLVDLLPTMVEAAGGTVPAASEVDGRSFLRVLRGEAAAHREAVFAAHTGDGKMNRSPMRCVRTSRYKYILNLVPDTAYRTHIDAGAAVDGKGYWESWVRAGQTDPNAARLVERYRRRPVEELYDLEADPYEQVNLAGRAEQAPVLGELRERVRRWRLEQGEDLTKVAMPEDARRGEIRYAG